MDSLLLANHLGRLNKKSEGMTTGLWRIKRIQIKARCDHITDVSLVGSISTNLFSSNFNKPPFEFP
jgi:hypothetical protein